MASRGFDSNYELSLLVAPPKRESRVDLSAATGRPVEGFFDFGSGSDRKRKGKDDKVGSSNSRSQAGGIDTERTAEVPTPWTENITSKLTAAQHTKFMDVHAQELMGEPVHHDADFREVHKAVMAEQKRYNKAFQEWARTYAHQTSFYSQSLRTFLQFKNSAPSSHRELPWSSKFRVTEHINASMLPNVSQEVQRATNMEYKAHVQACVGRVQIVPEEVFNDLVDTPWETLVDQQVQAPAPPGGSSLLSDPCAQALAKHPNVAFAATFDSLLDLLSCARADDQTNVLVSVNVQTDNRGSKSVFIESGFRTPVLAASDAVRLSLQAGCRSHLWQQSSSTFQTTIATHSSMHYANSDDRNQAAVSQAQLQKAIHTMPAMEEAYLYEIVEIGNLKGVVRINPDMFVGDTQSDALVSLSRSLFHANLEGDDQWEDAAALKAVILRPQPDRLSEYGGEQMTQDQCFAAWLASTICPDVAVCSPRLCTTTNRIVRVEWMTAAAGNASPVGQLGEVLDACLLQLLSNVVSLPQGEYLYNRLNGSFAVDVLKEVDGGTELSQLLPAAATAQDFPLIPPKWVPKADQAPYTFPSSQSRSKHARKRKK